MERCATDYYFRSFPPYVSPDCSPDPPGDKINGQILARLFRGSGILDSDTRIETQGLQRYFAPYELWFKTQAPAERITFDYAITGSEKQFNDALVASGIPASSLTDEQAATIIADVMYKPVREFIRARSQPPSGSTQIVIVGEIASPYVAELMTQATGTKGEIAGLGLSPKLLSDIADGDPEKDLYKWIGIDGEFSPTLFVGHKVILRYTNYPDFVIAHEMGHALGLQHDETDQADLMYPQASVQCRPDLTAADYDAMVGVDPIASQVGAGMIAHHAALVQAVRLAVKRLSP